MDLQNAWHRWGVVLLLATACAALTWLTFDATREAELEVAEARHEGAAAATAVIIRHELREATAIIETMADVARVSPSFTQDDFHAYSELVLERHPMLFSLIWAEWVAHDERASVVEAVREDGYAIEDVLTRTAEGVAPAPEREHYLVVRHFAPRQMAAHFVGVDAMLLPGRAEPVIRAMETGRATATPPVWVSPDAPPSTLVGVPIYHTGEVPANEAARRREFRGILAVGFVPQPLLSRWMEAEASPTRRTLVIADLAGGGGRQVMFDSLAGAGGPGSDVDVEALLANPRAVRSAVRFAGEQWEVVTVPTEAFDLEWTAAPTPWVVLSTGTAATVLLAVLVGVYLRHHAALSRHAEERSAAAAELARRVEEQARTQKELGRSNHELREMNSEMEQFVYAVSHDLKNPLVAVEIMCQVARAAVSRGDDEETRGAVERLDQSASMMRRIIDDLLAHSRAGFASFQGEVLDADALVRTVLSEHGSEAQACGARLEIAGRLPWVYGDRGRLTAVFDNLVGNAVRYACGEGGAGRSGARVQVGCRAVKAQSRAEAWRFYVRDNGPGVPKEARQRIFRMFERMSADARSTGIGLAIVDRAAKAHGGRVWVEDTPGGGATFYIEIPRHREAEGEQPAAAAEADDEPTIEVVVDSADRSLDRRNARDSR